MPDDSTYDINLKVSADTAGAEQAKEALSGVGEAAQEAGSGLHEAGGGAAEGKLDGLRETAIEAGHGFHGAHLAIKGLSEAAAGGEGAVTGLAWAMRGLGMAIGAGTFGIAMVALEGLLTLISKVTEATAKAKEEQEKLADEAEKSKAHVEEVVKAAEGLKSPADQWKESLVAARDALKETLQLQEEQQNSKLKVIDAQEKLALAQNDASDKSPEEKTRERGRIEGDFSKQEEDARQDFLQSQIDEISKGMGTDLAGLAPFKKARDDAKAQLDQAKAAYDTVSKKASEIRGEEKPDSAKIEQQVRSENPGMDAEIAKGKAGDIYGEQERIWENRQQWLKTQSSAEIAAAQKQVDDANATYTQANKDYEPEQKKADDAWREGNDKIAKLRIESVTSAATAALENQTRAAEQSAKENEEAGKHGADAAKAQQEKDQAALRAAQEKQHQADEALAKQREQQIKRDEEEARLADEQAHALGASSETIEQTLARKKSAEGNIAALRNAGDPAAAALAKQVADQQIANEQAELLKRGGKKGGEKELDPDAELGAAVGGLKGMASEPWNDNKALASALNKVEAAFQRDDKSGAESLTPRIIALLEALAHKSTDSGDRQTASEWEARLRRVEQLVARHDGQIAHNRP
jgi:hypothetical protein